MLLSFRAFSAKSFPIITNVYIIVATILEFVCYYLFLALGKNESIIFGGRVCVALLYGAEYFIISFLIPSYCFIIQRKVTMVPGYESLYSWALIFNLLLITASFVLGGLGYSFLESVLSVFVILVFVVLSLCSLMVRNDHRFDLRLAKTLAGGLMLGAPFFLGYFARRVHNLYGPLMSYIFIMVSLFLCKHLFDNVVEEYENSRPLVHLSIQFYEEITTSIIFAESRPTTWQFWAILFCVVLENLMNDTGYFAEKWFDWFEKDQSKQKKLLRLHVLYTFARVSIFTEIVAAVAMFMYVLMEITVLKPWGLAMVVSNTSTNDSYLILLGEGIMAVVEIACGIWVSRVLEDRMTRIVYSAEKENISTTYERRARKNILLGNMNQIHIHTNKTSESRETKSIGGDSGHKSAISSSVFCHNTNSTPGISSPTFPSRTQSLRLPHCISIPPSSEPHRRSSRFTHGSLNDRLPTRATSFDLRISSDVPEDENKDSKGTVKTGSSVTNTGSQPTSTAYKLPIIDSHSNLIAGSQKVMGLTKGVNSQSPNLSPAQMASSASLRKISSASTSPRKSRIRLSRRSSDTSFVVSKLSPSATPSPSYIPTIPINRNASPRTSDISSLRLSSIKSLNFSPRVVQGEVLSNSRWREESRGEALSPRRRVESVDPGRKGFAGEEDVVELKQQSFGVVLRHGNKRRSFSQLVINQLPSDNPVLQRDRGGILLDDWIRTRWRDRALVILGGGFGTVVAFRWYIL